MDIAHHRDRRRHVGHVALVREDRLRGIAKGADLGLRQVFALLDALDLLVQITDAAGLLFHCRHSPVGDDWAMMSVAELVSAVVGPTPRGDAPRPAR